MLLHMCRKSLRSLKKPGSLAYVVMVTFTFNHSNIGDISLVSKHC